VTDLPYTDADLRLEAAAQHHAATTDPDFGGIGEQMTDDVWRNLSDDDFDIAQRAIDDLLSNAADTSEWAVNLGAFGLHKTTELAWGHPTNWDLAVQLAHRPRLDGFMRQALTEAITSAVEQVLTSHGVARMRVSGDSPKADF